MPELKGMYVVVARTTEGDESVVGVASVFGAMPLVVADHGDGQAEPAARLLFEKYLRERKYIEHAPGSVAATAVEARMVYLSSRAEVEAEPLSPHE